MAAAAPRPRKREERSLRYDDASGVLTITTRREGPVRYRVSPHRHGGKVLGWRLVKDDGTAYDVDAVAQACDCKGCLRWGRCKHVAGMALLVGLGRVEGPSHDR